MNTLEELKYYCEENQPVGVMLLTGEWGCGKTYLIDHDLKETIKDTHIIIRISLFGINSIDELKSDVKKEWISAWGAEKGVSQENSQKLNKVGDIAKKVFSTVGDCLPDTVKNIGNSILSVNIIDFISIAPIIENKKVILVFDDLERANMSKGDLLGCINDYCENQHFNTIVVANEEKINNVTIGEIPYDEIKEKIIQRTVRHIPDYTDIIKGVIREMSCRDAKYKNLLQDNIENITTIFSGTTVSGESLDNLATVQEPRFASREEKEQEEKRRSAILKRRPHNIRSIKCVLQDFERVYDRMSKKQIDCKEKWLCSYLAYVMVFRVGLLEENERYGTLLSDGNLLILYPGFYNSKYKMKIKSLLQQGIEQSHTRMHISNDQKQYFTENEWDTYELISQMQEKSVLMFNRNRKRYVELMKE